MPYVGVVGGLLKIGYDFIKLREFGAIGAVVTFVSAIALWFVKVFKKHQ